MNLKIYVIVLTVLMQTASTRAMNKSHVQQQGLVENGVICIAGAVITGIGYLYNVHQIHQKKLRFQAAKEKQKLIQKAEKEQVYAPREKIITDMGDEVIFTPLSQRAAIQLEEPQVLREIFYEDTVNRQELSEILLDYYLQDKPVKSTFEITYRKYRIATQKAQAFDFSQFTQQDYQVFERLKEKISENMENALKKHFFGFVEYQKKDAHIIADLLDQYYAVNDYARRDEFKKIMDYSHVLVFKGWGQIFGCIVWHAKGPNHTVYCLRDRVANKYIAMKSFEIIHQEMVHAVADIIDYCYAQEHEVLLGRYGW